MIRLLAMLICLTPLIAAILMPLSSVTVVGFVTLATMWSAHRLWKENPS